MKLEDLIEIAKGYGVSDRKRFNPNSDEARLAQGIIDVLGASLPCGMIEPTRNGRGEVVAVSDGTEVANFGVPEEARAYAAAIIRTADSIDGGSGDRS